MPVETRSGVRRDFQYVLFDVDLGGFVREHMGMGRAKGGAWGLR
jgi:hypothetical protein